MKQVIFGRAGRWAALLCALWIRGVPAEGGAAAVPQTAEICQAPQGLVDEYRAQVPKTAVELQPFRTENSAAIQDSAGRKGTATLIELNPRVNAWFLLRLEWEGGKTDTYHLENPYPAAQRLRLDSEHPRGIALVAGREKTSCDLWRELPRARASKQPYAPLCDGRLFLRNSTQGNKTSKEWATDFLRNHVWGGEQITVFVREQFYRDAFLQTSEIVETEGKAVLTRPPGAPARPAIDPRYDGHLLTADGLGIRLDNDQTNRMMVGRWYRALDLPGVFVCALQPQVVAEEVILAQQGRVKALDAVESAALVYLVAFDLEQFELGFAVGTEHPRVDWSDRVPESVRDRSLPGPDGIGSVAPLVSTGMLNPVDGQRVVATFTGGYKRYHGAFKRGDLALRNRGSHYGFVEHGAVLSKLAPGLATAVVYDDGTVQLKTWSESDDADLCRVRYARQNGVPLVERDERTGAVRPGTFVPAPGLGNWSGSVDGRYRTLRGGLGLQEHGGNRFLIYGYFSGATASAMARVFQASGCQYAMLTDMNALEHTYMAVYTHLDGQFKAQNLIDGMKVLDKGSGDQVVPRFVGYADNRDFFYLLRKDLP